MDEKMIKPLSDEACADLLRHLGDFGTLRETKGVSDAELEAIYAVGVNFYKAGNYPDAEKIFRFLTLFEHTSSRFWTSLGSVQQVQKRYDEAVKSYQLAAFLDLHNPKPMYYAAECFLLLGDKESARQALASLAQYAPENENGRRFKAKGEALQKVLETK